MKSSLESYYLSEPYKVGGNVSSGQMRSGLLQTPIQTQLHALFQLGIFYDCLGEDAQFHIDIKAVPQSWFSA